MVALPTATGFGDVLYGNIDLEGLKLEWIKSNTAEINRLFRSLKQCQGLQELAIDLRHRTDDIAVAGLVECLRNNHGLTKLILSGKFPSDMTGALTNLIINNEFFVKDLTIVFERDNNPATQAFCMALRSSKVTRSLCITPQDDDTSFDQFLLHLPFLTSLERLRWERPVDFQRLNPAMISPMRSNKTLLVLDIPNFDSSTKQRPYHLRSHAERQLRLVCARNRFQRLFRIMEEEQEQQNQTAGLLLCPTLFASNNDDATEIYVGLLEISHIMSWVVTSNLLLAKSHSD